MGIVAATGISAATLGTDKAFAHKLETAMAEVVKNEVAKGNIDPQSIKLKVLSERERILGSKSS